MKKYITLFILIALLVTGCGNETNDPITFVMEHNSKDDIDTRYGENPKQVQTQYYYNMYEYTNISFLNYEGILTVDYDDHNKIHSCYWIMQTGDISENYVESIVKDLEESISQKYGSVHKTANYDYWNVNSNSITLNKTVSEIDSNYENVIIINFNPFNIDE